MPLSPGISWDHLMPQPALAAASPPASPAIVLAAGASRRMGRPKLLLPYGGTTLLGSLLTAIRNGGASPIVVVAAGDDAALAAWCGAAAAGGGACPGLRLASNAEPERGMLSSVLAGIAALGGATALGGKAAALRGAGAAPLLITPGDLPALRAATVAALIARQRAAGARLAVPVHAGRRGHPLAVAATLVPEIERLDPGRGLRQLLDLYAGELLAVEVDDPGCVSDVDTPGDYARLRGLD
jgi:molybdenum cofactor cytidylyltransferase